MTGKRGAHDAPKRQHNVADWLAVHELDLPTCRRILDAIFREAETACTVAPRLLDDLIVEHEVAWLDAVASLRALLPTHEQLIDDTFENIEKMIVEFRGGARKAFTLDNGPKRYPTIYYSFRGGPRDALVVAHEFAHAVQIRASKGHFVPPIVREACAFLGEGALVAYLAAKDPALHQAIKILFAKADRRHFGTQAERLEAALADPDTAYDYSWNYPIARFVASRLPTDLSPAEIWKIFTGEAPLGELVGLPFALGR